ncbi:MAG TPA: S-methyl-5-thioribose-1-phosphate isomerase [Patescibacteria group bacterium]|nr:S-methyl-5-thioribose-1-phosphate isomerase [Patescibacteria group bacterium]
MDQEIKKTYQNIKSIKIQGATNVAVATGQALKKYSKKISAGNKKEFVSKIKKAGQYLTKARATEPMAENLLEFLLFSLKNFQSSDIGELKKQSQQTIDYILNLFEQNNDKIIKAGSGLIKNKNRIFTHCHSSTVIKILKQAEKDKKNIKVFQTETRPLYQGHKTAKDLLRAGIEDTLVVDSAADFLLSRRSGSDFKIDKMIIGCDAISLDGSCVNKVGSFGLARIAHENKVPVYIATQSLKINEEAKNIKAIKIEQRPAKEVWAQAPKNLKILNPAFDRVPAEFIQGYICEFGIVKPKNLVKKIKAQYPWLWL